MDIGEKSKAGFTLIEVLIMIALLGIVLLVGSNLFFSILKGGVKTEVTKEVKQNGEYVLASMTRMVRGAKNATCDDPFDTEEDEWVQITAGHDGLPTTYECSDVGEPNGRIASNSARLTSERVKVDTCSISCEGTPVRVVTISFSLSQKEAATRVEERASQNFQTKVTLRIYEGI